jgi:hypothetical protein
MHAINPARQSRNRHEPKCSRLSAFVRCDDQLNKRDAPTSHEADVFYRFGLEFVIVQKPINSDHAAFRMESLDSEKENGESDANGTPWQETHQLPTERPIVQGQHPCHKNYQKQDQRNCSAEEWS